jgi:hypothetical protein
MGVFVCSSFFISLFIFSLLSFSFLTFSQQHFSWIFLSSLKGGYVLFFCLFILRWCFFDFFSSCFLCDFWIVLFRLFILDCVVYMRSCLFTSQIHYHHHHQCWSKHFLLHRPFA